MGAGVWAVGRVGCQGHLNRFYAAAVVGWKLRMVENGLIRYMTMKSKFRLTEAVRLPALFVFALLFGAVPQELSAQEGGGEYGTVYVIRRTGYSGALDGYSIFMDGTRICVLNNKKYSVHQVPAGRHSFNVRFGGKNDNKDKEHLEIEVEAGRDYYITVEQRGSLVNKVSLQELAGSSGKRALEDVTRDDSCR